MPVYFVQAGEDGPIKIGYAGNVAARVADLQVACPQELRFLAMLAEGTKADEAKFHLEFAADLVRGEWFNPSPALLSLISSVAANNAAVVIRRRRRRGERYRYRPSDMWKSYPVIGPNRKIIRTIEGPTVVARDGATAITALTEASAEYVEYILNYLRQKNEENWPAEWLGWLNKKGASERKIAISYRLHLPARPIGVDVYGVPTGVDEPLWHLSSNDAWDILRGAKHLRSGARA